MKEGKAVMDSSGGGSGCGLVVLGDGGGQCWETHWDLVVVAVVVVQVRRRE